MATAAQFISAGMKDITVIMEDSDAKEVMSLTPKVTLTINTKVYTVYEINPTVVTGVYRVRLFDSLTNSIEKDAPLSFGV